MNAKAEAPSPDVFHVSETSQGDSGNEIKIVGQGNSSESSNNNVEKDCAECEVRKFEYSRLQQEGAMREAKMKEHIDALTKKFEVRTYSTFCTYVLCTAQDHLLRACARHNFTLSV